MSALRPDSGPRRRVIGTAGVDPKLPVGATAEIGQQWPFVVASSNVRTRITKRPFALRQSSSTTCVIAACDVIQSRNLAAQRFSRSVTISQ